MTRARFWWVTASVSLVAALAVYGAGLVYGVETRVWDAAHDSFAYIDRPGSDLIVSVSFVVGGGLLAVAIVAVAVAVRETRRPTSRALGGRVQRGAGASR